MLEFFIAFIGVLVLVAMLIPLSYRVGLLDHPDNERKQHKGAVPLIGGIAMFASVALAALFFVPPSNEMSFLLTGCALLTMTGTLDDRYHLHYGVRLLIQGLAGCLLVWGSQSELSSLGNLFGTGDITLLWLSIPVTIIAVIALINAFNMIDGIDGLAGGLSLISSLTLYLLIHSTTSEGANGILLLLMGALLAYLILNLHLIPKLTPKIFMGDAGSMVLGFIITAFLIRYTQGRKELFAPTTALWVVAIPLMDIVATTIRRLVRRRNPFKPDRTHIHHILLKAGLSQRSSLVFILMAQLILSGVGLALEKNQAPHWLSFALFLAIFFFYFQLLKHAFFTSKWLRRFIRSTH
ncbi:undecaprenyl-phosphate alpha-N-acetylglucosaminyl 1-phosphatetransferase [gamma proteobacterium HTCC5015]|nr:undecaprenyl-phosphate alpha-N-acetylglucosaminyl 1-phosphatetransferase [gamma proteobacterium HTCC5015]